MKKILNPVLGLALAFSVSTAAMAQTGATVETRTTVSSTSSGHVLDSDGFVSVRDNLELNSDEDVLLRSTLDAELAATGPIYDRTDLAIRGQLDADQVAVYNDIMNDRSRLALVRMSPEQYAAFRSEFASRLDLTAEQELAVLPALDAGVAEATAIERATFANRYCNALGMERHELFTSEVASVELISEEVAVEREVQVEVRESEAVIEMQQTETFIRDADMK